MPPPAAESFQAWILSSDKGERYWNHRMRKKKLTGLGIDPVAYQVLMQDDFVQTKCRNFVNIITRGPEPITTSKRRKRKYHQSKRFNLPFYIFQTNQKLDNTRGRYAGSCSDWSMKPGETLDFCVSEYCVNCPICDLIGPWNATLRVQIGLTFLILLLGFENWRSTGKGPIKGWKGRHNLSLLLSLRTTAFKLLH